MLDKSVHDILTYYDENDDINDVIDAMNEAADYVSEIDDKVRELRDDVDALKDDWKGQPFDEVQEYLDDSLSKIIEKLEEISKALY